MATARKWPRPRAVTTIILALALWWPVAAEVLSVGSLTLLLLTTAIMLAAPASLYKPADRAKLAEAAKIQPDRPVSCYLLNFGMWCWSAGLLLVADRPVGAAACMMLMPASNVISTWAASIKLAECNRAAAAAAERGEA